MSLERHTYDRRDQRGGRFIKSPACDGCGKPVGTAYYTDDDVCQGSDGPGFYLCERKRCLKKREGLDIAARKALYEATRLAAKSDAKTTGKPTVHHSCEVERTKEVTHFTLNLATSETTPGRVETRAEPCGTPLWADDERRTGVCRHCLAGWTMPKNYPTEKGLALIASVKVSA